MSQPILARVDDGLRIAKTEKSTLLRDLFLIVAASVAMGLVAQVKLYLPFTPVPFTLQAQMALLLGAILGPRKALTALLLYLSEGAMGLPVFAGGSAGIASLIGPTGGYFAGMCIGAVITGALCAKSSTLSFLRLSMSLCVGSIVVLTLGTAWLSLFVGSQSFQLGFVPFIIGDCIKAFIAAGCYKSAKQWTNLLSA